MDKKMKKQSISPFELYREMILGHYSTAAWLQAVVLALWNGHQFKIGLSQLAGLDDSHYAALTHMLDYYRWHGENDPTFMSLADEIRNRRTEAPESGSD